MAVAATFIVVYNATGTQLLATINRDTHDDAGQIAQIISQQRHAPLTTVLAAARRYAASQPYGKSAALLFVLIPGVGTASNHPELFGDGPPEFGESAEDQARERASGRRLATPHRGYSTVPAADVGDLRVYERRLSVAGRPVFAGAAEPISTVNHAQESVARSFAIAGAVAIALAVIAAYLIGTRISAPLRRMARLAAQIDAGDLAPRITPSRGSSNELRVLGDAFNRMLDRLSFAFEAQREFVADASHELRTPLTVMRGQLDLLAVDGAASPDEIVRIERLLQAEIARITRLVDDLLLLAQSERRDFLHPADVDLKEFIVELWDGLSLTAQRNFEVGALPRVVIRADPDRLAQALRNLARNAIEHTREPDGLVRIDLEHPTPLVVRLVVTDDGPGLSSSARERVFERFYRTDPARSRAAGGAGLGLAIVRAIAEAHRGTVRAVPAPGGGARFELDLPRP